MKAYPTLPFFVLLLGACCFFAACDAQEAEDEPPAATLAAYFPLALGQVWTYDYAYQNGPGYDPQEHVGGILRWEVKDVRDARVAAGQRIYRVHETFAGTLVRTPWYDAAAQRDTTWSKTHYFSVGKVLDLDAYSAGPIEPLADGTMPDTLFVSQPCGGGSVSVTGCSFTFVKGEGLVRYSMSNLHMYGFQLALHLTRE